MPKRIVHISRSKAKRVLEKFVQEANSGFEALHKLKMEEYKKSLPHRLGEFLFHKRYKRGVARVGNGVAHSYEGFLSLMSEDDFVATIRSEEKVAAEEAGIFDEPRKEEFYEDVSESLVNGVVTGVKAVNNYHERHKRNGNGHERGSLPFLNRAVSVNEVVNHIQFLREQGYLKNPDDEDYTQQDMEMEGWFDAGVDGMISDQGFGEPEIPRYVKPKVKGKGHASYWTPKDHKVHSEVNSRIDSDLSRGVNPFRPERRRFSPW